MAEEQVLPSWAATPTRDAIVSFVEAVTGDGPEHVPEAERIAVFDNDGTLWTEKPMVTQVALHRRQVARTGGRGPDAGRAAALSRRDLG